MWPLDPIADAALDALRARDAALREEQAVYGLDAQPELSFHPLIAEGLRSVPSPTASTPPTCGVLREQPFPHEWFRKLRPDKKSTGLALPLPRDRQRCDIVLTPEPDQTISDSLITEKQRRADEAELQGTLFESLSTSHLAPGSSSNLSSDISNLKSAAPPESCFWLELKVCGQYTNISGVPGPNRTYTGDLTRAPLADLKKLADDHRIHHAGVLLIVFTESETVAKHDIAILAHRILDREWPITSPVLRSFPITDRIGNSTCTVCLIGMRKI